MINLKEYEDFQEVTDLLAECMYPDEERVRREAEAYKYDTSRRLLGMILNEELAGLIGVIHNHEEEAELKHIAIKSSYRRQGLGKKMIMTYMSENRIRRLLRAETDKDAVEFYRRIGFEIISLGEKYPGVERFECINTAGDSTSRVVR